MLCPWTSTLCHPKNWETTGFIAAIGQPIAYGGMPTPGLGRERRGELLGREELGPISCCSPVRCSQVAWALVGTMLHDGVSHPLVKVSPLLQEAHQYGVRRPSFWPWASLGEPWGVEQVV